jgi:hypothetical protein
LPLPGYISHFIAAKKEGKFKSGGDDSLFLGMVVSLLEWRFF